jgi:serralysin
MTIQPTVYEQYLLELINWARANPAAQAAKLGITLNQSLAAGTISDAAKQPLVFNAELIAAARGHSDWMLAADIFSHTGINGSDPGTRMSHAGYEFGTPSAWGENIAWVGSTGALDPTRAVATNHDNLFLSSGHRVAMMNNGYKEVGLAALMGAFTQQGITYNAQMVTENFATSGTASFLTGVVLNDRDGDRFYDIGEGVGGATITASGSAGTFQATSWDAGGYRLELPPGAYTVQIAHNGAVQTAAVTIGTQNVKLDGFTNAMTTAPGPMDNTTGSTTTATPVPLADADQGRTVGTDAVDVVRLDGGRSEFDVTTLPDGTISVQTATGGAAHTFLSIERFVFDDGQLAFDLDGVAGQAFRLYQAAFDRAPDIAGLGFWIDTMDAGMSLRDVAARFIASPEFVALFGPDNDTDQFVANIYANVLDRQPDPAGQAFWVDQLQRGADTAHVLASVSESDENVARLAPAIDDGIWFV